MHEWPQDDVERGVARERTRIAVALENDVLQWAASIRQDLVQLQRTGPDEEVLQTAVTSIEAVIAGVRSMTLANNEQRLSVVGVREAVERIARDAAQRGRLELTVELDDGDALNGYGALLKSAVRELTDNVVLHAGASSLTVELRVEGRIARLSVRDDGPGLPSDAFTRPDGGLVDLVVRVRAAGGELFAGSTGGGTEVAVCLPSLPPADRLAAERALEAANELSSASVPWSLFDADGTMSFVSNATCRMMGYSRSTILAHARDEQPPWLAQPKRIGQHLELAREVGTSSYLAEYVHGDGTTRQVLTTAYAMTSNAPVAFLVVSNPVADDHRLPAPAPR